MHKFEKILEIEKTYRRKADGIFANYKKEESLARVRLSPEAFKAEFICGRWAQIAGNFRFETDLAVEKISQIFKQLRDELHEWMVQPVAPGILETLRCVRDFGLRLSFQELKAIESGISDSYLGKKVLVSIAKDSGFFAECINIDELLSTLETAESIVESRIRSYAGHGGEEGFPGKDLLDHKTLGGVDLGEYSLPEIAMASVEPESDNLDFVKKLWERAKAPMTYVLTSDEAKSIEEKLNPLIDRWGDIDGKGLNKVKEEMPDILSRLESMPDDYEHKESFEKYLLLNHVGQKTDEKKEAESILDESPSMELAKGYADKLGPANMDILNQF